LTFLTREHKVDLLKVKMLENNAQLHLLEEQLKRVIEHNENRVFEHYDKFKINVSTVVSSQGRLMMMMMMIMMMMMMMLRRRRRTALSEQSKRVAHATRRQRAKQKKKKLSKNSPWE
jgi:hypothetical protein